MMNKKEVMSKKLVLASLLLFFTIVSTKLASAAVGHVAKSLFSFNLETPGFLDLLIFFMIFMGLSWLGFTKWFGKEKEGKGAVVMMSIGVSIAFSAALVFGGKIGIGKLLPAAFFFLGVGAFVLAYALLSKVFDSKKPTSKFINIFLAIIFAALVVGGLVTLLQDGGICDSNNLMRKVCGDDSFFGGEITDQEEPSPTPPSEIVSQNGSASSPVTPVVEGGEDVLDVNVDGLGSVLKEGLDWKDFLQIGGWVIVGLITITRFARYKLRRKKADVKEKLSKLWYRLRKKRDNLKETVERVTKQADDELRTFEKMRQILDNLIKNLELKGTVGERIAVAKDGIDKKGIKRYAALLGRYNSFGKRTSEEIIKDISETLDMIPSDLIPEIQSQMNGFEESAKHSRIVEVRLEDLKELEGLKEHELESIMADFKSSMGVFQEFHNSCESIFVKVHDLIEELRIEAAREGGDFEERRKRLEDLKRLVRELSVSYAHKRDLAHTVVEKLKSFLGKEATLLQQERKIYGFLKKARNIPILTVTSDAQVYVGSNPSYEKEIFLNLAEPKQYKIGPDETCDIVLRHQEGLDLSLGTCTLWSQDGKHYIRGNISGEKKSLHVLGKNVLTSSRTIELFDGSVFFFGPESDVNRSRLVFRFNVEETPIPEQIRFEKTYVTIIKDQEHSKAGILYPVMKKGFHYKILQALVKTDRVVLKGDVWKAGEQIHMNVYSAGIRKPIDDFVISREEDGYYLNIESSFQTSQGRIKLESGKTYRLGNDYALFKFGLEEIEQDAKASFVPVNIDIWAGKDSELAGIGVLVPHGGILSKDGNPTKEIVLSKNSVSFGSGKQFDVDVVGSFSGAKEFLIYRLGSRSKEYERVSGLVKVGSNNFAEDMNLDSYMLHSENSAVKVDGKSVSEFDNNYVALKDGSHIVSSDGRVSFNFYMRKIAPENAEEWARYKVIPIKARPKLVDAKMVGKLLVEDRRVRILADDKSKDCVLLNKASWTFGKSRDADVVISYDKGDYAKLISDFHFRITREGGAYYVTSVSDKSAVILNENKVPINSSASLAPDSLIEIKDTPFRFRFVLDRKKWRLFGKDPDKYDVVFLSTTPPPLPDNESGVKSLGARIDLSDKRTAEDVEHEVTPSMILDSKKLSAPVLVSARKFVKLKADGKDVLGIPISGKMIAGRWGDINFEDEEGRFDKSVSREQFILEENSGVVSITDSGSVRKTLVNGAPLSGVLKLKDGDVISIAKTPYVLKMERSSQYVLGKTFSVNHISPARSFDRVKDTIIKANRTALSDFHSSKRGIESCWEPEIVMDARGRMKIDPTMPHYVYVLVDASSGKIEKFGEKENIMKQASLGERSVVALKYKLALKALGPEVSNLDVAFLANLIHVTDDMSSFALNVLKDSLDGFLGHKVRD